MQDPREHLAKTLKALRKDRALSLDKLADMTGVSKAMLGQIERGESSPTVSTLWKIATGLGVSFSSFIEHPPARAHGDTVHRIANEMRQPSDAGAMLIAPLFPFDGALGFEYLELTFLPGYERVSAPHVIGTLEIITVISGEMEILSNDQWHHLKTGESLRFPADRPHGYRNLATDPAKIINVIHYANRSE